MPSPSLYQSWAFHILGPLHNCIVHVDISLHGWLRCFSMSSIMFTCNDQPLHHVCIKCTTSSIMCSLDAPFLQYLIIIALWSYFECIMILVDLFKTLMILHLRSMILFDCFILHDLSHKWDLISIYLSLMSCSTTPCFRFRSRISTYTHQKWILLIFDDYGSHYLLT